MGGTTGGAVEAETEAETEAATEAETVAGTVAETEAETEAETGAQALGVLRDGEAVLAVRVVQLFLLCEHTIACPLGIHLRSCRGAAIITRASGEHRRLTLWRMEKSERTSVKVSNNSS